ncbi:MAG: aldolase catalytic domain-containing protein [Lachnospiraceae bacterium]|nr:aldolase catalytic domain-containing protein [Lachnospiraceae bacterium]
MKSQLLDCTLRDGGYVVNKDFDDKVMLGIINGLENSNIDYIEIGFLQDDISGGESTVYLNAEMAKKWIPSAKKSIYAVLADLSRYSAKNLEINDGTSFDAVRLCFFKHERKDIISFSEEIIKKGYRLFINPVDTLGYSHMELLQLIEDVNKINPDGFSIVDTFGSMYLDDLRTIFNVVNYNLSANIKMGFHSHNNLQMSSSLAQEFFNLGQNQRDIIVDTTLLGIGRGAGNTPTELTAQYLNAKMKAKYNMDLILDTIDNYIASIKSTNDWGYDVPMFISGCYSAHVNNISYLQQKPSLRFQDLNYILNRIGSEERKRYNYQLLEKAYFDFISSNIDDSESIKSLAGAFLNKELLVLAPGKSILEEHEKINDYINKKNPVIISVNFIPSEIAADYLYFSNKHRYEFWKHDQNFNNIKKIVTSNIDSEKAEYVISLVGLVKSGWSNLDNSVILLLRLLDKLKVKNVALAGFDGYSQNGKNFIAPELERDIKDCHHLNMEISQMYLDFIKAADMKIRIITNSIINDIVQGKANE